MILVPTLGVQSYLILEQVGIRHVEIQKEKNDSYNLILEVF